MTSIAHAAPAVTPLEAWRVLHAAAVARLRMTCCGVELCPECRAAWDAADAAERALPWRVR